MTDPPPISSTTLSEKIAFNFVPHLSRWEVTWLCCWLMWCLRLVNSLKKHVLWYNGSVFSLSPEAVGTFGRFLSFLSFFRDCFRALIVVFCWVLLNLSTIWILYSTVTSNIPHASASCVLTTLCIWCHILGNRCPSEHIMFRLGFC